MCSQTKTSLLQGITNFKHSSSALLLQLSGKGGGVKKHHVVPLFTISFMRQENLFM